MFKFNMEQKKEEMFYLLSNVGKVEAIKEFRRLTLVGLKEAKGIIDFLEHNGYWPINADTLLRTAAMDFRPEFSAPIGGTLDNLTSVMASLCEIENDKQACMNCDTCPLNAGKDEMRKDFVLHVLKFISNGELNYEESY